MSARCVWALVVAASAGAIVASASSAVAATPRAARAAAAFERGLSVAVARRRLSPVDASQYRRAVAEAVVLTGLVGPAEAAELEAALTDASAVAPVLDRPRAFAVATAVAANVRVLRHGLPSSRDVADSEGVVYRWFRGHGLCYHPLASFGHLNSELKRRRWPHALRLAWALLARAEPQGGALTWEYYFPTANHAAPWTSGLVQAVAAQALARAGLLREARAAYAAIPRGLLIAQPGGPWIRLYSFSDAIVLNAQLQAIVSLREYAARASDTSAANLADRLAAAAKELLPRFDTGSWSRYDLGGTEASLDYHVYVSRLLTKLARGRSGGVWLPIARRFRDDWRRPPRVRAGRPRRMIYAASAGSGKAVAPFRVWLSKPARVTVRIAGTATVRLLGSGWHRLSWDAGRRGPGSYKVQIDAVDRAGNATTTTAPPIVIAPDRAPPRVTATLVGRRLSWRGRDNASRRLTLEVVITRGGATARILRIANVPLKGGRLIALPAFPDAARLLRVADAAGNKTTIFLLSMPIG